MTNRTTLPLHNAFKKCSYNKLLFFFFFFKSEGIPIQIWGGITTYHDTPSDESTHVCDFLCNVFILGILHITIGEEQHYVTDDRDNR